MKNNYWISSIFHVKLPMSMVITWLDFQLSINNQNGRHLATIFFRLNIFFIIPLKPGIYRFSGSASQPKTRLWRPSLFFNYNIPCYRDNLTNNYWISPILYMMLPMSMEMTWLDFQLSTYNQNGRHLANNFFLYFFSRFPSNIGFRGLRVYWHCLFSCATENEAIVAILKFNLIIPC